MRSRSLLQENSGKNREGGSRGRKGEARGNCLQRHMARSRSKALGQEKDFEPVGKKKKRKEERGSRYRSERGDIEGGEGGRDGQKKWAKKDKGKEGAVAVMGRTAQLFSHERAVG